MQDILAALKTHWWPSAVVSSLIRLLSLWHIPHFHSQFYHISLNICSCSKTCQFDFFDIFSNLFHNHIFFSLTQTNSKYILQTVGLQKQSISKSPKIKRSFSSYNHTLCKNSKRSMGCSLRVNHQDRQTDRWTDGIS